MYKEVLQSADGIGVYPMISLVIFFLFFVGLIIWVAFYKESAIEEFSKMPLNDGTGSNETEGKLL